MKNYLTSFLMGVVVGVLILITTYKLLPTSVDNIVVDTVYVDREIIIPEIKEVFIHVKPKPTSVDTVLVYKTDTVPTPIISRTYENTYTSKDSVATVVVKDSILDGELEKQEVLFEVKERPIQYKDKIITKTITKKPVLAISLGAAVRASEETLDRASVVGFVGVRGKNGLEVMVGYDTNKTFTVGIKKDILTIFK